MAAETIHSSLAAPLPQTNPAASHQLSSAGQNAPTDDEQLSEASLIHSLSQQQVRIPVKCMQPHHIQAPCGIF